MIPRVARWLCGLLLLGCRERDQATTSAEGPSSRASAAAHRGDPALHRGARSRELDAEAGGEEGWLYPRALRVWVLAEPRPHAERLGYLRAGSAVRAARQSAGTEGCEGGWLQIRPRGYVCAGRAVTFDEGDALVQATRGSAPSFERRLPYLYGTVRRPGPVYRRLPSAKELAETEPDLERRMEAWLTAPGESGAAYAQDLWVSPGSVVPDPALLWREQTTSELPSFLGEQKLIPSFDDSASQILTGAEMRPRAGYSFSKTFVWKGRRYGLVTDLTLAPTDRFRPIRGSDFHGVELGEDIDFPFAFVRSPLARFYERGEGKALIDAGPAPYRAAIPLTGKRKFFRERLHFETRDGKWLSDEHASELTAAKRMPGWGKKGERWLDVNLTKQTLVAYDGERAVFATLISSGEAGLDDHTTSTATKRGIFRIHTKHVSATMSSDELGEEFELRDVPYVQYFDEGYALHGAYWHDRFGTPKSHGCINLAPEDARRLFFFTEPKLPDGHHGVLLPLRGSVVFVHP